MAQRVILLEAAISWWAYGGLKGMDIRLLCLNDAQLLNTRSCFQLYLIFTSDAIPSAAPKYTCIKIGVFWILSKCVNQQTMELAKVSKEKSNKVNCWYKAGQISFMLVMPNSDPIICMLQQESKFIRPGNIFFSVLFSSLDGPVWASVSYS